MYELYKNIVGSLSSRLLWKALHRVTIIRLTKRTGMKRMSTLKVKEML